MPEPKGRKKRRERDRERRRSRDTRVTDEAYDAGEVAADAADDVPVARVSQPPVRQPGMPSPTARFTGFMVALVTAILAIVMVYNGFNSEGLEGFDRGARVVGGLLLVLLAIFVGVLSVAPEVIRDLIQRRRANKETDAE